MSAKVGSSSPVPWRIIVDAEVRCISFDLHAESAMRLTERCGPAGASMQATPAFSTAGVNFALPDNSMSTSL